MEDLLTTKQAAKFVGLSESTLNQYRVTGRGPRFIRLGGSRLVRYDRRELETWARSDQRLSTSEAA